MARIVVRRHDLAGLLEQGAPAARAVATQSVPARPARRRRRCSTTGKPSSPRANSSPRRASTRASAPGAPAASAASVEAPSHGMPRPSASPRAVAMTCSSRRGNILGPPRSGPTANVLLQPSSLVLCPDAQPGVVSSMPMTEIRRRPVVAGGHHSRPSPRARARLDIGPTQLFAAPVHPRFFGPADQGGALGVAALQAGNVEVHAEGRGGRTGLPPALIGAGPRARPAGTTGKPAQGLRAGATGAHETHDGHLSFSANRGTGAPAGIGAPKAATYLLLL